MKNKLHTDLPSHEQLLHAKSGKISDQEMELINSNELFSEAYEGYLFAAPTNKEINDLKLAVNKRITGGRANLFFSGCLIFTSCIYIAAVFSFTIKKTGDENEIAFSSNSKAKKEIFSDKRVKTNPQIIIETADTPEKPIQKTGKVAVKPNLIHFGKLNNIDPIFVKNGEGENKKLAPLMNNNNAPVKYIADILVIDYGRTKRKLALVNRNLSTPANTEKGRENFDETTIRINTDQFLEKGITSFSVEKYQPAISYLNELAQYFPDDLNANFYKAMSFFKMEKYAQAIPLFDKAINADYTTFQQDAMWYKALSLIAQGKKAEAKEVLVKIVNSNGYYLQKAKAQLETLND